MSSLPLSPGVGRILVGGYTVPPDGHAVGISSWRVTGARPEELVAVPPTPVTSPSFLVAHPHRPWVLAVSETSPSQVSSFQMTEAGSLVPLGTARLSGDGGCHLAVTADGRHAIVAHYGSGGVSSVRIADDGSLSAETDLLPLTGTGPDPERQHGPHAHQVVVLGEELLVCDLGGDRIHRVRVDDRGRLTVTGPPVLLPPGSGPRHLVVLGEHLVVVCELSAELWLGRRDATGWQQVDRVPSSGAQTAVPPAEGAGTRVYPSGVVADGLRVFVANRGVGTVGVFDLDADADRLVFVTEVACGGADPRDLTHSPGRLWVSLPADDVVTVLPTASLPPTPAGGFPALLDPDLSLPVASPTCVLLLAAGTRPAGPTEESGGRPPAIT